MNCIIRDLAVIIAVLLCHVMCEVNITQITKPLGDLLEGPHWDEEKGVLFFVGIEQNFVYRYDPQTEQYTRVNIPGDGGVSLVIPVKGTEDKFVVTSGRDMLLLTWDGKNQTENPEIEEITLVEPDKTGNRFNDGKADVTGRVWAGTMGPQPVPNQFVLNQGDFFSIDTNTYTAKLQIEDVSISNGLAWNANNTILYYIDSLAYEIVAYDFDVNTAEIKNKRTVFDFASHNIPGMPDGMTIDSDENLLIACFNGSRVIHVDPRSGNLLREIVIPASDVTSVMFGNQNLDILYVTTSSYGLSEEELNKQPLAGSLFSIKGLGLKALAPAYKAVRTDY